MNFEKLNELTFAPKPALKVKIYGAAHFEVQPHFEHINGINVDELYESAWLAHRNTVLRGQYYLTHADFTHNIVSTVRLRVGEIEISRSNDIFSHYFRVPSIKWTWNTLPPITLV